MISGEELQFIAGGGAISLVAVYLSKAVLTLVQNKSGPKAGKLPMISVAEVEQLTKIYREIENSHEDRDEMLKVLRKLFQLIKELHNWHDQRDEDGVLKWLNKPSVERRIAHIEKMLESMLEKDTNSDSHLLALRVGKKNE